MDPAASMSHFRETRESPFSLTATGLAVSTDDPALAKTREDAAVPAGRPPVMRICHLCGTPQLLKSFRCHASRCAQAWLAEETAKPKGQRRPLPEAPEVPPGKLGPAALAALNRTATRVWKEQSLETCPNCGRSFHGQALRAHLKGCHGAGDQFLGAAAMRCSIHLRRQGDAQRSYPSVAQALQQARAAPVVSRPAPVRLDPAKIATKRAVPTRDGAPAPLTFHKTPAERVRAERALRRAGRPKPVKKATPAYAPPPPPPRPARERERRRPWGAPRPPGERQRPKLEARVAQLEREKADVTSTLKRIEALLGGAGAPAQRAARRSVSPGKRRSVSPTKRRSSPLKQAAVDAGLPPPPPPTRGHRLNYDRAFRTSSSFSLAWPED